jgi:hypothetical protein
MAGETIFMLAGEVERSQALIEQSTFLLAPGTRSAPCAPMLAIPTQDWSILLARGDPTPCIRFITIIG